MNWWQPALEQAVRWSDANVAIDAANGRLAEAEAQRREICAQLNVLRDGIHEHMLGGFRYCGFTLADMIDGIIESAS